MSTVPMRLIGHINSNSLFAEKSPKWSTRKLPYVTTIPIDCPFSVWSTLSVFELGQYGFTCPAPGNDDLIVSPADD